MERPTICFSCKRTSQEVKILDAVKEARPVKVCESCARFEDIILIRKPTSRQLSDPNRSMSVYNRLKRLSGLDEESPSSLTSRSSISLSSSTGSDYSQYSIKKRKEMMASLNKPANLVEHAHWIVQKERRSRRMTLKQLSDAIAVPENVLKMIEEGKLPDDGRRIMEKLEQYFHVKLIRDELRSPGFNKGAVYRNTSDYDYTKPKYYANEKKPSRELSAEILIQKIPSEIPKSMPTREERNFKSPLVTRPLPTTKHTMSTMSSTPSAPQGHSSGQSIHGLPLNAGASSSRITHRPVSSIASDAAKTQSAIGNTRPTQAQYSATQSHQTSLSTPSSSSNRYMVPNPSKVTGASTGRTLSLAADAMKNAQNIPRVQNASRLAISRDNVSNVTLSQLQDIKKEKDRVADERKSEEEANKEFKGEIEFVDLDEE